MRIRTYYDLPSGQVLLCQAYRTYNEYGCEDWELGIVVGRHRKECRQQFRGGLARTRKGQILGISTGKCGLRSLILASIWVREMQERFCNTHKWVHLIATPYDEKRERAYRYLHRLGFQSHWCNTNRITEYRWINWRDPRSANYTGD